MIELVIYWFDVFCLWPDPSSHYVITLKAFNNVGEGIPVYESAITRPQSGKAVNICGGSLGLLSVNSQFCSKIVFCF